MERMSNPHKGSGIPEEEYRCKPCHMTFNSDNALKDHKVRRHICCDICGMDFRSDNAKKNHRVAVHGAEQDLECPHCHEHFNRLGGLVSHYELTECSKLGKEAFEKRRQEIVEHQEAARAAHNFKDFGRSVFGGSEPLPPIGRSLSGDSEAAGKNGASPKLVAFNDESIIPTSINIDEDLISFDEQSSAILNAPWGMPVDQVLRSVIPKLNSHKEFPALNMTVAGTKDGPSAQASRNATPKLIPAENFPALGAKVNDSPIAQVANNPPASRPVQLPNTSWGGPTNFLFPNATAAVAPPTELLRGLSISSPAPAPVKIYAEFDPDDPKFIIGKYWNSYTNKFKCPHRGCGKSHKTDTSFVAHLKSPAHRNEKLQCHKCLRYFDTATALTQHSESQGVRCNIRESDNYESVVVAVTANTAVPDGRWEDDTIKYSINREVDSVPVNTADVAANVVEAHRAAHQAKNDQFNNYWVNRHPKW